MNGQGVGWAAIKSVTADDETPGLKGGAARVGVLRVAIGIAAEIHDACTGGRVGGVADSQCACAGDRAVQFEATGVEGLNCETSDVADAASDLGGVERVAKQGGGGGDDDVTTEGHLAAEAESGTGGDEQRCVAVTESAIRVWQHVRADKEAARTVEGGGAGVGVQPTEDQGGCTGFDEVAASAADNALDAHFTGVFKRAGASDSAGSEVDIATQHEVRTGVTEVGDDIHVVRDAEAGGVDVAFGTLTNVDAGVAGVVDDQRAGAEGEVVADVERGTAVGPGVATVIVAVHQAEDGVAVDDRLVVVSIGAVAIDERTDLDRGGTGEDALEGNRTDLQGTLVAAAAEAIDGIGGGTEGRSEVELVDRATGGGAEPEPLDRTTLIEGGFHSTEIQGTILHTVVEGDGGEVGSGGDETNFAIGGGTAGEDGEEFGLRQGGAVVVESD